MPTTKKTPSKPPVRREDRPGHLDPNHAASLLAMSGKGASNDDRAFVNGKKSKDGLAEELGEGAVSAMTSGGEESDALQADVEEERGKENKMNGENKMKGKKTYDTKG